MRFEHPSVLMIEAVVKALGDLKDDVVFVGGSTVPFYIEDEGATEPRPTKDVDCIIELVNYSEYGRLESKLREKGFVNSQEPGDPICRWKISGVTVDVMPTDENIIGFSNKWYKEGMKEAGEVRLPSGTVIKIFTPAYFVASKFEAYLGRGTGDFRLSHDIEDVMTLLDGILDFDSIQNAPETVHSYLRKKVSEFLEEDTFLECISSHLEPGPSNSERAKRILSFFETMSLALQ